MIQQINFSSSRHSSSSSSVFRNATVDFEGGLKYTPLHYAASAGHSEIVKILLQRGANPMKKTLTNETPYHLAFKNDKTDVLKLLYDALPTRHKPYDPRESIEIPSQQVITSLTFISSNQSEKKEMKLVAGSRDCLVSKMFSLNQWMDNNEHTQGCGNSEPTAGHFGLFSPIPHIFCIQLSFNLPDIH